jgi:hypothetical protein
MIDPAVDFIFIITSQPGKFEKYDFVKSIYIAITNPISYIASMRFLKLIRE